MKTCYRVENEYDGQMFSARCLENTEEDLLLTLQYIQEYYKAETKHNSQNNVLFVEAQIDKVDKKLKNLINIYTDGDISKEEFQSMRKSYDDELVKLKEQKRFLWKTTKRLKSVCVICRQ